jgi:ABC-type glycerol-3-phosphate transport system substrate-binding protein
MRISSRALFIGLLALTAVSCGADASTQTTDSVSQLQSISITDFNATLVGGGDINLQSELQKSPVALWFWAPG